jgi:hypothetical protein
LNCQIYAEFCYVQLIAGYCLAFSTYLEW